MCVCVCVCVVVSIYGSTSPVDFLHGVYFLKVGRLPILLKTVQAKGSDSQTPTKQKKQKKTKKKKTKMRLKCFGHLWRPLQILFRQCWSPFSTSNIKAQKILKIRFLPANLWQYRRRLQFIIDKNNLISILLLMLIFYSII